MTIDSEEQSKSFISQGEVEKAGTNQRSTNLRWVVLVLVSFSCIGNYFSSDLNQSMMNAVIKEMGITNLEYNMIFSVYAFPNIILPFLGGLFVDFMGIRIAFMLFSFLVICGQTVITLGAANHNFTLMLIGQVIFATGGDSMLVAKSSMVSKWFRGKELSFALSAGLCVGRLGSSLDSFMSPRIYNSTHKLYLPYLVSCFVCAFSFCVICVMSYIDKRVDKNESAQAGGKKQAAAKPNFRDFKNLPKIYYTLVINCGLLYLGFYGFVNNISDILIHRFGFTQITAGNVIPIIFITPVILTPMVGLCSDKYGKRVLLLLGASTIYFFDNIIIAFFPDAPAGEADYRVIGMLIGLGLFYSGFAAVFWPCVALVVKPKMTGVAYGCCLVFQNIILMIGPLALGKIHDDTLDTKAGYFWTQIVLCGVIGLAIGVAIVTYILDMKGNKVLDSPSKKESESLKDSLLEA